MKHYPDNLMNLYPCELPTINYEHYPHNLLCLYPAQLSTSRKESHPMRNRIATCPVDLAVKNAVTSRSSSARKLMRPASMLNPRSPGYNVEFALADAMLEKPPSSHSASPSEAFVRHKMLSTSGPPAPQDDQTSIKQFSIFVGDGVYIRDVVWLQVRSLSMMWFDRSVYIS